MLHVGSPSPRPAGTSFGNVWHKLGAGTGIAAAFLIWLALYRAFPAYPPRLGPLLAIAAILFFVSLAWIRRIHLDAWPGLAQFGFFVSGVGLILLIVGGGAVVVGLRLPARVDPLPVWLRFTVELLNSPQPGWGLFCVGLIPVGAGAIRKGLPLSVQLLAVLGALFLLGPPVKYLLGTRTGGLSILAAFGAVWVVVVGLVFSERTGRLTAAAPD
jgi:hypothetical protein